MQRNRRRQLTLGKKNAATRQLRPESPLALKVQNSRLKPTQFQFAIGSHAKSIGTILLIVLVVLFVGAVPNWPHSKSWGYGPGGGLAIGAIAVITLLANGQL
jgi:hypothetical protein